MRKFFVYMLNHGSFQTTVIYGDADIINFVEIKFQQRLCLAEAIEILINNKYDVMPYEVSCLT